MDIVLDMDLHLQSEFPLGDWRAQELKSTVLRIMLGVFNSGRDIVLGLEIVFCNDDQIMDGHHHKAFVHNITNVPTFRTVDELRERYAGWI